MERFEHCLLEFYWSRPAHAGAPAFPPSFTIFHPDGREESAQGGNPEVTAALSRLGKAGWRGAGNVATMNWILWTLERKLP